MITIRDVARLAGVSVATVSRVLNDSAIASKEARDKVMKAVKELGYRPNANAQALATQISDTIGVVVMDVSDPFFGALVKAVDTVAQRHKKNVLINNSYHQADKERHAIEVLIRQRCSALVVHAKILSDEEMIPFMVREPGMVLINRILPGFEHRCVGLDNVSGALMATRTLLKQGHRQIGYIGSNHPIEDERQRRQGFMQAMAEEGIVPSQSWQAFSTPDLQGGEEAMVELLGRNQQLTAVFVYNDGMAVGALATLKENGIAVPTQFSVVGFDDIPISRYTSPNLTTIRYPIFAMAVAATELALLGTAGRIDEGQTHLFMPTLVRRHSVAPWKNVAAIASSSEDEM
ncbi:HTH-type transcriptional regulator GalS [Acerihabitans arboris]|uniref:HTH-type transcriptional regulator GalS n=1 Tax=Acerihabitans arboris TaxID=2691583 RepID=A0A845SRU3_9GAMM|nr:HTH-type transcriptional regulator GalS [Acerihabitans arboris]NDL65817.1 HTH-type transcriptional regulator GalS [Acerihabitans arboris]